MQPDEDKDAAVLELADKGFNSKAYTLINLQEIFSGHDELKAG